MQTANVNAIDVSKANCHGRIINWWNASFVFSALSMNAVGRAAMAMIEEVRRQFRDIPKLKAALEVMRQVDSDMTKATEEQGLFLMQLMVWLNMINVLPFQQQLH